MADCRDVGRSDTTPDPGANMSDLQLRVNLLEEELAGTEWRQRATFAELDAIRRERDALWREHESVVSALVAERDALIVARTEIDNSLRYQVKLLTGTARRALRSRFSRGA